MGALLQPAIEVDKIQTESSLTGTRRRSFTTSVSKMILLAGAMLFANGCGNSYRPVVTAINPVGPAGQPQKYAVAISQPTPTGNGLLTIVDFSGDSILITATLGLSPYYLAVDSTGSTGYTLNGDGTVNSFGISNQLLSNQILQTTLIPSTPLPNSIFPQGTSVYITEPGRTAPGASFVAQLQNSPPALRQELPVGPNVVYIAGVANAPRIYAISQNTGGNGQVTPIETSSNTTDTAIPVGVQPVYGVMTADGRRAFILNRGSNTVSVINAQTNTIDTPTTVPDGAIPVGTAPVWADFAPTRSELAVLNAGSGGSPGSLSLINIPLCSAVALPTNPNCDPNNPVDAAGFGQVLANIPVGVAPVVVAVLQDGTRAYVANFGDNVTCATLPTSAIPPSNGCGTVSVVNLTTNTVTATIPVAGHPTFLAATTGNPTGKIYVTSNETSLMTVLRTDIDTVQTYVDLQGRGGQVRMTAQ